MKERPILFSGPMVQAILDGRKTQTRRVVKPQPGPLDRPYRAPDGFWYVTDSRGGHFSAIGTRNGRCPHGVPGDRLWVRETWGVGNRPCPHSGWIDGIEYRADCVDDCAPPLHDVIPGDVDADSIRTGWRPSIHMPRWACRLVLEIADIRVERLNDISEADTDAEGFGGEYPDHVMPDVFPPREGGWGHLSMPECYRVLWEHINGPGSWDANPWVWVIEFKRVAL